MANSIIAKVLELNAPGFDGGIIDTVAEQFGLDRSTFVEQITRGVEFDGLREDANGCLCITDKDGDESLVIAFASISF